MQMIQIGGLSLLGLTEKNELLATAKQYSIYG